MAGKAVKSAVTKAVVKYQYPWKEKLAKYKDELSKGVWGYWHLGAWKPLDLSGRHRARLRKEVLLAGQDWPYDPARKEMRNKRKGHKCDRISAEKRANTAELMKKMPEMLLDYKINASDDRSSSTIESKILDVVQMNSVMADGKPKCLVIDEIDGALGEGKGAVEAILKLVAADKKSLIGKENNAQEAKPGKLSSRKGPKASILSRPVICICNDLFAPALRPLRQVAKVHTFVQPTVSRVVNRLKYICNKEGFKASTIALTALAEFTGFSSSIIDYDMLMPPDLEKEFGLTGGNIFHGAMGLDSLFLMRPVKGWSDYRTPLQGLYLCGSGTHPPGGGCNGSSWAKRSPCGLTRYEETHCFLKIKCTRSLKTNKGLSL